jgi:hypothetical protein
MNHFAAITALSPDSLIKGTLRNALFDLFLRQIDQVKYPHFKVYIFGSDQALKSDKVVFIPSPSGSKGDRMQFAYNHFIENNIPFDYIARLDDDDLISTTIFEQYAKSEVDLITDKYHSFIDLCGQGIIQQQRDWIPNTAFHRKDHALKIIEDSNISGLAFDHDHFKVWKYYYEGKNVGYTDRDKPVYLRVLNPGSITSMHEGSGPKAYQRYLRGFGRKSRLESIAGFDSAVQGLSDISKAFELENFITKPWYARLRF